MTDDQGRRGSFDDIFGDCRKFVDAQDAVDLNEETLQQAEAPTGEACDSGACLRIGEVIGVDLLAEASAVAGEDELEPVFGLADGQAVLSLMGDQAEVLKEVEQHVPPQLPRQMLETAPVWNGERLYFAPWYPLVRTTNAGSWALELFKSLLAMGLGHRRIRLLPGELLVVDNGRWLHGRDKLERRNGRRLHRFWLR